MLADVRGFVFDLDGTLVRRSPAGAIPLPGAGELLERIRASGRRFVIFTNASHATPARIAAGVREGGLPVEDGDVLTPVCSASSHLTRRHPGARVLALGTEAARGALAAAGVELIDEARAEEADVVLVLHVDRVDLTVLERAAHAVIGGAAFLAGNYQRAYAGASGPILSRGAMAAAAIAKGAGRRPTVVGKPSRVAMREAARRLGAPAEAIAVVGDDLAMDIALGRLVGARTVLVRSGISGGEEPGGAGSHAPDLVVDVVGDLLDRL